MVPATQLALNALTDPVGAGKARPSSQLSDITTMCFGARVFGRLAMADGPKEELIEFVRFGRTVYRRTPYVPGTYPVPGTYSTRYQAYVTRTIVVSGTYVTHHHKLCNWRFHR
jgi:hypothetical protein